MCFSLEMDLVAGTAITVIGLDALTHAHRPATRAVAAVPILLGVHQLIEAVIWADLDGDVSGDVGRVAMWLYLVVAMLILPWFIPAVAAAIEPTRRRRVMYGCAFAGAVISSVIGEAMVRGPVEAMIGGNRIVYDLPLTFGGAVVVAYVTVVVLSLVASSHPEVRWFGVATLIAAAVIAWADVHGFVSLWCLWAAVASVVIAVYLRRFEAPRATEVPSSTAEL